MSRPAGTLELRQGNACAGIGERAPRGLRAAAPAPSLLLGRRQLSFWTAKLRVRPEDLGPYPHLKQQKCSQRWQWGKPTEKQGFAGRSRCMHCALPQVQPQERSRYPAQGCDYRELVLAAPPPLSWAGHWTSVTTSCHCARFVNLQAPGDLLRESQFFFLIKEKAVTCSQCPRLCLPGVKETP